MSMFQVRCSSLSIFILISQGDRMTGRGSRYRDTRLLQGAVSDNLYRIQQTTYFWVVMYL